MKKLSLHMFLITACILLSFMAEDTANAYFGLTPPSGPIQLRGPAMVGSMAIIFDDKGNNEEDDDVVRFEIDVNTKGEQRTAAKNYYQSDNSMSLEDIFFDLDETFFEGFRLDSELSIQLDNSPQVKIINTVQKFSRYENEIIIEVVILYGWSMPNY